MPWIHHKPHFEVCNKHDNLTLYIILLFTGCFHFILPNVPDNLKVGRNVYLSLYYV